MPDDCAPPSGNGGKWKPGQSGNPNGRPEGSRNKASLAVDELLEGEAEALTRKAIERALAGDATALRLCLERLCPPRRERPISFALPAIRSMEDVSDGIAATLTAVAAGEITPGEGAAVAALLETKRKAIETIEMESRLAALEARGVRR